MVARWRGETTRTNSISVRWSLFTRCLPAAPRPAKPSLKSEDIAWVRFPSHAPISLHWRAEAALFLEGAVLFLPRMIPGHPGLRLFYQDMEKPEKRAAVFSRFFISPHFWRSDHVQDQTQQQSQGCNADRGHGPYGCLLGQQQRCRRNCAKQEHEQVSFRHWSAGRYSRRYRPGRNVGRECQGQSGELWCCRLRTLPHHGWNVAEGRWGDAAGQCGARSHRRDGPISGPDCSADRGHNDVGESLHARLPARLPDPRYLRRSGCEDHGRQCAVTSGLTEGGGIAATVPNGRHRYGERPIARRTRYELARKFGMHAGMDVGFSEITTAIYFQMGNAWFRP